MRRLLLALVAAGVVAAAVALTATARGPATYDCGVRSVDVFFWPHGHPAIPRLRFPAFPPPHAEVYKARDVKQSAFLAFTSKSGTSVKCRASRGKTLLLGKPYVSTTKQTKLRCSLPGNAELQAFTGTGAGQIMVATKGAKTAVAGVSFYARTKTLAYRKGVCKPVGLYK